MAAADDPRVAANLRDAFPSPYTQADADEWIMLASSGPAIWSLAITRADTVIGGVGAIPGADVYQYDAEIGYWLGVDHWGQGFATEAVRAYRDHLFRATPMQRLHARVFAGNGASSRVLVKAGFTLEGVARRAVFKRGRFLDVEIYACLRDG